LSLGKAFLLSYNEGMKIKQTRNTLSDTYLDAMKIRQSVFVQEQGVPRTMEIDKNEAHCLYFVLYDDNGKALATCRLLPDDILSYVTLQRMAVLKEYRGKNLGITLLDQVLEFCRLQGFKKVILHAQLSALNFYEKFQFSQVGQTFEEAGIQHVTMEKTL
jgi:predicted GNAT family N-acyltransferase